MNAHIESHHVGACLLYEPDPPAPEARVYPGHGWRSTPYRKWQSGSGVPVRCRADDALGARLQRGIVRYALLGVTRRRLAEELVTTPNNIQLYLRGVSFASYTRPVLRALDRLGIGRKRGRNVEHRRCREIHSAATRVMARAARVIEGQLIAVEARSELIADLRLLAAVEDVAS